MATAVPAGSGDFEAWIPRVNLPTPGWNLTLTHRCRYCGSLMRRFSNGRWAAIHAGRWSYICPARIVFHNHRPK